MTDKRKDNSMYQNYIFDLYGTLVDIDTDEKSRRFWQKMTFYFNMKGTRYCPEELQNMYETTVSEKLQEIRNRLILTRPDADPEFDIKAVFQDIYARYHIVVSDAEIADTALAFRAYSIKYIRLFPGVSTLLAEIKKAGHKAYLLSNAQSLFTSPELSMLGLAPCFDGILLSSDAGVKKPDPMFYHMLTERFRIDPACSVMVGNDDTADCHGAAAAGIDSIYLCTRQSPERLLPLPDNCRQLKNIREVRKLLRS